MLEILANYWWLTSCVSFLVISLFSAALYLRRVVPTNQVHIVQSGRSTISYGKDTKAGNVYYEWPHWIPLFGVSKVVLPVSVFDLDLIAYEAYDKGRLPFVVDVKAFFRIDDTNVAAQRVAHFAELQNQLKAIVQGAIRTVLANSEIDEIMQGRSKFGQMFTDEVVNQLPHWGVTTVKNIELMDLRDSQSSQVITQIMAKKKSFIEMESRQEVAKNQQAAKIAEINARREVDLQEAAAAQTVGMRKVETDQAVSIAAQKRDQEVKKEAEKTQEREMAVLRVSKMRQAEMEKDSALVTAERDKQVIATLAQGKLEQAKREAEAITATGVAKAEAEKALQLAPVAAQLTLAKEIGSNAEYQKYLTTIKALEVNQAVGLEQAKALEKADVKVIANSGDPGTGIQTVSDLFSSKGGQAVGAMIEGLANSPTVKALTGGKGKGGT